MQNYLIISDNDKSAELSEKFKFLFKLSIRNVYAAKYSSDYGNYGKNDRDRSKIHLILPFSEKIINS